MYNHVFGDIDQIFIIFKQSAILSLLTVRFRTSPPHQGHFSFLQTWGLPLAFNIFKLSECIMKSFDGMDVCAVFLFRKDPHFQKSTRFSLNISCCVHINEKNHEIRYFVLLKFGSTMLWNSVQIKKPVILRTDYR